MSVKTLQNYSISSSVDTIKNLFAKFKEEKLLSTEDNQNIKSDIKFERNGRSFDLNLDLLTNLQQDDKVRIVISNISEISQVKSTFKADVYLDVEVDFVKIRSYEGDSSTGTIKFRKDISANIDGRDIIIVEDIIDSGFTINFLVNRLRNSGPRSVSVATALFKKEVAKLDFEVDYVGFEIPPEFVVGYGLDYDEKYRQLKDVMVLEPEDIN